MGILSSILTACAGERPGDLGVRNGQFKECPGSPNCVSSQAADEAHRITPLLFTDTAEQALARLRKTLAGRPDTTIIAEDPGYLRVEFRTTLFVDDGEFFVDPEQRQIHVRSASRLGYSDLGKNRSRMEEVRRQFAESAAR
ncbi:MAG: DUF1499 domain-containing protein [Desulforhopalus sp.]|nr:DUF1499 domain-containing protein [Desulforhopalus sp.]